MLAGHVYVPAIHQVSSTGIWKFDLNFANPQLVKEMNNGASDAGIRYFSLQSDKMIFTSDAGGDGFEVWTSDGTTIGTKPFAEIAKGISSDPVPLNRTIDGRLFVQANSAVGRGIYLLNMPLN